MKPITAHFFGVGKGVSTFNVTKDKKWISPGKISPKSFCDAHIAHIAHIAQIAQIAQIAHNAQIALLCVYTFYLTNYDW